MAIIKDKNGIEIKLGDVVIDVRKNTQHSIVNNMIGNLAVLQEDNYYTEALTQELADNLLVVVNPEDSTDLIDIVNNVYETKDKKGTQQLGYDIIEKIERVLAPATKDILEHAEGMTGIKFNLRYDIDTTLYVGGINVKLLPYDSKDYPFKNRSIFTIRYLDKSGYVKPTITNSNLGTTIESISGVAKAAFDVIRIYKKELSRENEALQGLLDNLELHDLTIEELLGYMKDYNDLHGSTKAKLIKGNGLN